MRMSSRATLKTEVDVKLWPNYGQPNSPRCDREPGSGPGPN